MKEILVFALLLYVIPAISSGPQTNGHHSEKQMGETYGNIGSGNKINAGNNLTVHKNEATVNIPSRGTTNEPDAEPRHAHHSEKQMTQNHDNIGSGNEINAGNNLNVGQDKEIHDNVTGATRTLRSPSDYSVRDKNNNVGSGNNLNGGKGGSISIEGEIKSTSTTFRTTAATTRPPIRFLKGKKLQKGENIHKRPSKTLPPSKGILLPTLDDDQNISQDNEISNVNVTSKSEDTSIESTSDNPTTTISSDISDITQSSTTEATSDSDTLSDDGKPDSQLTSSDDEDYDENSALLPALDEEAPPS